MAAEPERIHYTPEEYLALEREAEYKNEYIDGVIIAMTGASRNHSVITFDVGRRLGNQLEGQPCDIHIADMRVRAGNKSKAYTYPDVVVVCGKSEFEKGKFATLLNPTLIVEVLSPSTEYYDRGKKFARYREIASLQDYILIAQDEVSVEHFVRQGELWVLHTMTSLDDTVQLPSIGCTLSVAAIYQKIEFPPSEEEATD